VSAAAWGVDFPLEWPRRRLKHICRFVGGGTPDKSNAEYWNGDIPWVSPKDMKSGTIDDTEDYITREGLGQSATRVVEPGAVLIVMRSGILRHSIPVANNSVPVALNQDMRALIPLEGTDPRFLRRLIEGHQQLLLNVWRKVGSTVESLESDRVAETEIALPPLPLQRAIADYLDRETARIDALIAAKERLAELLAEKRRALITRAVTRGLDPDVPFRDSGIPWLGEIPAHWKIIALRFLVEFTSGGTPDTGASELWDGDVPWVSPKDMKRQELAGAEDHVTELALNRLHLLPPGSVLMVVRGMILAHSFPAAVTTVPVTINQDMKALTCRSDLDPRFLRDYLRGVEKHVVSLAGESAHGTRKLETELLGRLEVPVPPLSEQEAIVRSVANSVRRLDALRGATLETITLLKERRAAVIAAAVTGQLDIPEVAA